MGSSGSSIGTTSADTGSGGNVGGTNNKNFQARMLGLPLELVR